MIVSETPRARSRIDATNPSVTFASTRAGASSPPRSVFNDAAMELYRFVWNDFCDWYVELAKGRLTGDDEAAAASARGTLSRVMKDILGLLHPILAEAAMAGSSITVVANANSLRRARLEG